MGTRRCGRAIQIAGATILLAGGVAELACRQAAPSSSRDGAPSALARNLVVVTIDTLRADRVGAYGHARARTPSLDAVARRGVRFDRAFATAPITLTSHASLLSGQYPPGHGARHNGMAMRPVPTLATVLRERGFATGAFVGAFPLDARFGLAHGFDTYSDRMPRGPDGKLLDERPGDGVADDAIAWLGDHAAGRFFLWVHVFEPHAPYGNPSDASRPVLDRYDDDIATADRAAGRVIAALGSAAASTLVVAAGDHGEAFGEHGEVSHSLFVYDTTLRVPLLMAGPGMAPAGSVVVVPVCLVDVVPTVLHALRVPLLMAGPGMAPAGSVVVVPVCLVDVVPTVLHVLGIPSIATDGVDLHPLVRGEAAPTRELYAESFAPLIDFGWSALRSVRSGPWKFIAAPAPELYNLADDPGELRSVAASEASSVATLDARVGRYGGAELPRADVPRPDVPGAPDRDTRARLQSLGYAARGGMPASGPRVDPKERRDLARRLALIFSGEARGPELKTMLQSVLRDDPGNGQAHLRLGFVLLGEQQCGLAASHFTAAVRAGMTGADPFLGLATCAGARNDLPAAEAALRQADAAEPGNPVVQANLGILWSRMGRTDDAIATLAAVVRADPAFDEARFHLALAYARAGRRQDAAAEARVLLGRLPANAPQRAEVSRLLAAVQ